MRRIYLIVVILGLPLFSTKVLADDDQCCRDCTCFTCGQLATCGGPADPADCDLPEDGDGVCGVGTSTLCSEFWENNTEGVTNGSPASPTNPDGCIPIDGGLGFLIAGGLGMGVIGIRRRKEEAELKRV